MPLLDTLISTFGSHNPIVIGSTGGTGTGIIDIFNPNLDGVLVTNPDTEIPTTNPGTGTGTGTGTSTQPNTQNTVVTEREQVIERVRTHPDLDPNAKIKILNLAKNRPSLTAQDLRLMLAVSLYPTAYGLPAPEGYEYFLRELEKGQTVAGALSDAQTYYEADKAQAGTVGDPTAPDTQAQAEAQGRLIIYALVAVGILIFINR